MPNSSNVIDQSMDSDIESNGDASTDRLEAVLRDFCDSALSKKGRGRPLKKSSDGLPELVTVLQALVAKVDMMAKELFDLAPKLINLTNRVEKVDKENIELKKSLTEKNVKIEDLEQRMEAVEIQARSEFVVLSGQNISSDGPNLRLRVSEQISQELHVSREKSKGFSYQRLGKSKNKVLVRIQEPEDRIELFRAARTICPRNLFVNDFLTPARDKLFFDLRKQKHQRGLHSVFSFRGQIYIKKTPDGDMILVKSLNDLD